MIPNTLPYYVFIRISLWAVLSITPASAAYCLARALGYGATLLLPWPLQVFALCEVLFYVGVSLPRQWMLNRSSPTVVQRSRQEREALFDKSLASTPDLDTFLSVWFRGAPPDSICRDDYKDFLAWAFFYQTSAAACDTDELDAYVHRMEEAMGRVFPAGRGPRRPSQVSTDPLRLQHKPLVLYLLAIGTDDILTYAKARLLGLQHYRLPLRDFFTVFPLRPHTLFTRHTSPSSHVSYWHRPHTSPTRLPVLFIHGIGAGLRTYIGFLADFIAADVAADGQTGVIALELMPISMRVTREMLPREEMLAEILAILDHHGWDRFAVMGHSYGTILATHLLQHLESGGRVGPLLLVDPVTFSMQWGDIPYNFIYRQPHKASEWQLHYFASTDMGAAHSITRRFDWTVNVLWREELKGRTVTVVLAGRDIILDTRALQSYLAADEELSPHVFDAKDLPASGRRDAREGLDIVWYDDLNHAEVFESAAAWRPLVPILHSYCEVAYE
ncbi:alpha beta hydrolase fold family [Grosmannia clavigera kw1407]|uniref:Alpha beta hydrolase fold family n=1 Tax=Grosmannia clavigera (strain kw1407 / UAMH 11150) TaxID=655863 RepID=F0XK20_GROCL|nr:alpha beta hydrolase fold family [Grosmannia clavigera kw1407]EFX01894.1 alpha beta hydrolase fold family [Grosmannia clavigera kw1407]